MKSSTSVFFERKPISNKEEFIDICQEHLTYLKNKKEKKSLEEERQEKELQQLIKEKKDGTFDPDLRFDWHLQRPQYWTVVSDSKLIDKLLPCRERWPEPLNVAYEKFKKQAQLCQTINCLSREYQKRWDKNQLYSSKDIFHLG